MPYAALAAAAVAGGGYWAQSRVGNGKLIPPPLVGMSAEESQYFQQNVFPLQQQLLDKALNPNTVKQNVAQAESDVAAQYKNLPSEFQETLAGQGVVASPAQMADFNKQAKLNAGIATAGAANQARAATQAQAGIILRGGV